MSMEEALQENTAALKALTAVMAGGKPATTAAPTGNKGPGRPKKVTLNDVKIAAEAVKAKKGRPAAVELIKEHGGGSLAELP